MSIEMVKVSEKGKQQLITLKKRTGIENWNILCRWALCVSLAESSVPPHEDIITDSNIEMSWKTFAGEFSEIYLCLLKQRIFEDYGNNQDDYYYFLKLHLHRGISYLVNKVYKLEDFIL